MAAVDGQCRNPRNDDKGQSRFSGITPHVQERNYAYTNYVVSSTADVHKAITELKENPIQKVDGLPSRLEGKACESNMMGLNGTEAISEKQSDGPNAVKPKSSWTRFNRMDFGLGGLQRCCCRPMEKGHFQQNLMGTRILRERREELRGGN